MGIQTVLNKARKFVGATPPGHGPVVEGNARWVDAKPYFVPRSKKPYAIPYKNGVFQGYDGSMWMYFRNPQNVKIDWPKDLDDPVINQAFFVSLVNSLGATISSQVTKTRKDQRRQFHVQITRDTFQGFDSWENITPAQRDYMDRMHKGEKGIGGFERTRWSGYTGVQLMQSSILADADGAKDKAARYFEVMRDVDVLREELYTQEIRDIVELMTANGFGVLDFETNPDDYERITAWHGVKDEQYGLPRQLESTRVREPLHGQSLIIPRRKSELSAYDEVSFFALKPKENTFMMDPQDAGTRWGAQLFDPSLNIVSVNIRGEVRTQRIVNEMLTNKRTKKMNQPSKPGENTRLMEAEALSSSGFALMDNVEVTVGVAIYEGVTNSLNTVMGNYNLEALLLVGRQVQALMTTFPCYPKPIFRIRRGNNTRSPLSNQMYAGVIAMSGIYRSTQPCGDGGLIIGLSDARNAYEYKPVFTKIDAAYEFNKTPTMLITGRPGAGKSQELIQLTCQITYGGHQTVFLNPKVDSTLKPVFDHLGGITINMGARYLESNPGIMDPVFFIKDRIAVSNLIADAIFKAMRLVSQTDDSAHSRRRTALRSEIRDRALNMNNQCSGHIIFGNGEDPEKVAWATTPLSDDQVLEFVRNRMNASAFWKAFISVSPSSSTLADQLLSRKPVLIEWDDTLKLPGTEKPESAYTDPEVDSILSMQTAFQYASTLLGQSRAGGALIVDEAHVLLESEECVAIIQRAGKEWRQRNIMLIFGTQRIVEFLPKEGKANMGSYISRILLMAIAEDDPEDLERFWDLTALPRTAANRDYIINAGTSKGSGTARGRLIPRAYYIDRIYGWEGGVVCGPWPTRELNLGRTDKEGEAARAVALRAAEEAAAATRGFGGELAAIVSQDRMEDDLLSLHEGPEPAAEPVG